MEKRLKAIKGTILVSVIILLLGVLAVLGYYAYHGYEMYTSALDEKSVSEMAADIKSRGRFVDYDDLPEFYVNAVIAAEDQRFWKHSGIDIFAICRAVLHDIKVMSPEQGGSTITQQLAKNEFFTQEKKLERKFAEAFMAFRIEKSFSKKEIFALYVNSIYFGSGYYGIDAAAEGYFGKSVSELSDYECAMLAGLPNAPSAYSPDVSSEFAVRRTAIVIDKMEKADYITEKEASELILRER